MPETTQPSNKPDCSQFKIVAGWLRRQFRSDVIDGVQLRRRGFRVQMLLARGCIEPVRTQSEPMESNEEQSDPPDTSADELSASDELTPKKRPRK
jgi:hypothetical protein